MPESSGSISSPASVCFLADAHLRPGPQALQQQRLQALLETICAQARRLILLGDTFNFWYERRGQAVGDYGEVLALFAAAAARGLAIDHVCGNRDFVVGAAADPSANPGFFRDGALSPLTRHGIHPCGDRYDFVHAGRRILCLHGDELCALDRRYQFLRSTLRSRWGRWLLGLVPLWLARQLIAPVQTRRVHVSEWLPNRSPGIDSAAAAREIEAGADLLFCGHVHYYDRRPLHGLTRQGELIIVPPWAADEPAKDPAQAVWAAGGHYGILSATGEFSVNRQDWLEK